MKAYQMGNFEAFQVLYGRYEAKVFGFLQKRLHNEALAQDLFQKVFLRIHENRHRYDATYKLSPWIFTITQNILRDYWKEKKPFFIDVESVEDSLPEIPAPISVSLDQLSPIQQQAIELRYKQDQSFEDIGRTLRKTPANIRKIISRALGQLKKGGRT